jgi:hypothetical protein
MSGARLCRQTPKPSGGSTGKAAPDVTRVDMVAACTSSSLPSATTRAGWRPVRLTASGWRKLHAEGRLVMSGPWEDDSGALLVLDTDRAGLEEVMAADEYFRAPGVTVVWVREWSPLFGPRSS